MPRVSFTVPNEGLADEPGGESQAGMTPEKDSPGCPVREYTGSNTITGEFDPGSERTLAASLTHASRAGSNPSGGRVSNT